ncbi:MAG TPA: hypothetical protein VF796_21795 [Humisphaera sp.]
MRNICRACFTRRLIVACANPSACIFCRHFSASSGRIDTRGLDGPKKSSRHFCVCL